MTEENTDDLPVKLIIEEMPFEEPENEPNLKIKRWGSEENLKRGVAIQYITHDEQFEKVVEDGVRNRGETWFISVSAHWCDPCKKMEFDFNFTAVELKSEINVAFVSPFCLVGVLF